VFAFQCRISLCHLLSDLRSVPPGSLYKERSCQHCSQILRSSPAKLRPFFKFTHILVTCRIQQIPHSLRRNRSPSASIYRSQYQLFNLARRSAALRTLYPGYHITISSSPPYSIFPGQYSIWAKVWGNGTLAVRLTGILCRGSQWLCHEV
jgi:hypothetical protein